VGLPQEATQGVAPDETPEELVDPLPELLHRPVVTGQAVVRRVGRFDGRNDLLDLLLGKRGERPPV
jgi:hypothetical protein